MRGDRAAAIVRDLAPDLAHALEAIPYAPIASVALGYPDGDVHHTYQASNRYDLAVSYDWFVRWRIGAGGWQPLVVPPTTWSIDYRIDELVGRRTG